jgi:hypothetical protein
MPRYRVLRDFGSHLGNHYRGEHISLPEGDLPRGFAGFVERDDPPESERHPDRSEPPAPPDPRTLPGSGAPAPTDDAEYDTASIEPGYDDKMLRPAASFGHGHVTPRPDGAKARCGGPGICPDCSKEQAAVKRKGRRP